ncbi:MAG: ribosome small subunit-dependent GTPase A [Candidatus Moranbacteria bacterium]|nr:ribosome small subunit-dependent GTPase A [Candidatus Moranbacteria bacterium]
MNIKRITIEDLGWDEFFEVHRVQLGLDPICIARVTAEQRGAYRVKNTIGEYLAKVTGKHIFKAVSKEDYPAVGDWVAISELEEKKAVIESILPRKTVMKRKQSGSDETQIIATNIDVALVIESVDRDYSLNRLERYFSIASDGGIRSAIVLNKVDLISKEALDVRVAHLQDRFKDIDIILTSTLTDEGSDTLKNYIAKGKTYCFLGSSGVGKSSLINKLLGNDIIKTGAIGVHSGRGKHVTTAREMYFLENGGIVIDNPGVREVGITDVNVGVEDLFEEVAILAQQCQFVDCSHEEESECAVLSAVQSGELNKEKYANYLVLKKEAKHYGRTKFEKKEKDRQFGKFLKKAKKDLRKYNHKDYGE